MLNEVAQKPRIVGVDVAITDILVAGSQVPALPDLTSKYDLRPGGKRAVTGQEFSEIAAAVNGHVLGRHPGGSIANSLVTLNKLVGSSIDAAFLSAIDDHQATGRNIRDAFRDAGVHLLPFNSALPPQSATSYVLILPSGERSIVTYSGNAKDVLKGEDLARQSVDKADVVFLAGSLWQKLGRDFPDALLKERWEGQKELWLTLPTNPAFARQNAEHFRWLIPSANLVLGNMDELESVYAAKGPAALKSLQDTFRYSEVFLPSGRPQTAFITDGGKGAYIVNTGEITHIPPIRNVKVINTLGAGDTAFAGFLSGYVMGLPHDASAMIGMTLAAEKLRHNNGARLPDPLRDLQRLDAGLAYDLLAAQNRRGGAGFGGMLEAAVPVHV